MSQTLVAQKTNRNWEMGNFVYRRADIANRQEMEFIARVDIEIPALFDADFSTNENAFQDELKRMDKLTNEDFFDVAVSDDGDVVAFHIIKKIAYFDRFAGSIYTLWVSPNFRKQGIATELKRRGEAWAKNLNLDHIHTWVHVANHQMLKLNTDLGYKSTHHKMIKKI